MSRSMYRHAPKIDRVSQRRADSNAPAAKRKRAVKKPVPKSPKVKRNVQKAAKPTTKPKTKRLDWRRALRAVGTGVMCVATAVGAFFAWKAVAASERLRVRTIEIAGANHSERESILSYAGVRQGQSILEVNLDGAAQAMRRHPWIAEATVTRTFPDRLKVRVVEHRPAALVTLEGLYLVNGSGEVFKRWTPGDPKELPVVTGFARDAATKEPADTERQLRIAMALFDELDGWSETLGPVEEVHFDQALGWSAVTRPSAANSDPVQLALGFEPHERVALAARSLVELERRGLPPAVIWADGRKRPSRVQARLRSEDPQAESEVSQ